jgi:hypothetical protein
MFADPQSVTINAVAQSLPRTSTEDSTSVYTKDDETVQLTIAQIPTSKGRVRRSVRVDVNKMATDPFTPANSRRVSMSATLVIDEPADAAFSNTEMLNNVKSLVGWSSDANLTKVIAGES